jgi:uncharacterized protein YjbI with pentapeptide repeats
MVKILQRKREYKSPTHSFPSVLFRRTKHQALYHPRGTSRGKSSKHVVNCNVEGGHCMANQEHLDILKQGGMAWNLWREEQEEHADIQPDLSGANLRYAPLNEADLRKADLNEADLSGASLNEADLSGADLRFADLRVANLNEADLNGADLSFANLSRAHLCHADLRKADLREAVLVGTNLAGATLTNCHIYGIAAWNVELKGARQNNLVITPPGEPTITVDNLKIAQFIYLLLNNVEIRQVIDTITSKVVLILGRFTPERKAVLDAIRDELRKHNYSPILFDFEKPASRDLTGTVSTLAHLARFIIVDLTDPSSAPHEVATVIPHTVVPVQPVMLDGQREYGMFRDLRQRHQWVLPTYFYTDQAHLLATLKEQVIAPAEQKAQELEKR